MSDIRFADGRRYSREWLDANEEQAQSLLRQHKQTYPLCLCTAEGVPMYIRQMQATGKCYLARMPGTGPDHAVTCPSFEPIHGEAESEAYRDGAIAPLDDGRILFRLDVGFGVRDNSPAPPVARPDRPELPQMVDTQPRQLGLFALLQFLWAQAELHHWHPKMRDRRGYRQVYKHLLMAAEQIVIKGFPMSHRLFIPEPFRKDDAMAISTRRLERLSRLSRSPNGQRRRFLALGQVRRVRSNADVVRLNLAHVSDDVMVQMPLSTWERLTKRWRVTSPTEEDDSDDLRLWALFLVDAFQNHILLSRAAALMQTTAHYLPVFRPPEISLTYGLVESERRFIKLLAYDGRPAQGGPTFLLTDCGDQAIPLYIATGDLPITAAVGEWYWHADRDDVWPALPTPSPRH